MYDGSNYASPHPHYYIKMVLSSFPKNVVFSAHICHNSAYIFLWWQWIAIPIWAQLCCDCQGGESPPKVFFHWRVSSTEVHHLLPPRVIIHQRSSSTEGYLPPKVVFHQRSSSIESCLSLKVIFHWRSSSTGGPLPTKVIFHWRSSSTEGHLQPTITPWLESFLYKRNTHTHAQSHMLVQLCTTKILNREYSKYFRLLYFQRWNWNLEYSRFDFLLKIWSTSDIKNEVNIIALSYKSGILV